MTGAAFWPSLEGAQEPGKRVLQGELELKKALRPSFTFPGFALRVSVTTLALRMRAHGGVFLLCAGCVTLVIRSTTYACTLRKHRVSWLQIRTHRSSLKESL